MKTEIQYSKINSRRVSTFFGIEMLYDFLSKNLDDDRHKAVGELISQSREIELEIEALKRSLKYLERLSETTISETLQNRIKAPTSYYQGFLKKVKFVDWPVGIKLGFEALFVSTLIFTSIILIPWHRINNMNFTTSKDLLLVELEHEKSKGSGLESEVSAKVVQADITNSAVTFKDEGAVKPSTQVLNDGKSETAVKAPATEMAQVPPKIEAKPIQAKNELPKNPQPTPAPVAAAKEKEPTSDSAEAKQGVAQGYLYRGTIAVANLPVTSQKFVEKITSMGGRRAGEVEMGWKKGDGTYFHFTIPDAKYELLKAYLNEYGKLKIQRERHERVMPDGIIRLIITVSEEKSPQ